MEYSKPASQIYEYSPFISIKRDICIHTTFLYQIKAWKHSFEAIGSKVLLYLNNSTTNYYYKYMIKWSKYFKYKHNKALIRKQNKHNFWPFKAGLGTEKEVYTNVNHRPAFF